MMLVGSALWAYIIVCGCAIVVTLNPEDVGNISYLCSISFLLTYFISYVCSVTLNPEDVGNTSHSLMSSLLPLLRMFYYHFLHF